MARIIMSILALCAIPGFGQSVGALPELEHAGSCSIDDWKDNVPEVDPGKPIGRLRFPPFETGINCTAFMYDETGHFLTAGHCLKGFEDQLQVPYRVILEFFVPDSWSDGRTKPSKPGNQYSVDIGSFLYESNAPASDWGLFKAFPNKMTGKTPLQIIGNTLRLCDDLVLEPGGNVSRAYAQGYPENVGSKNKTLREHGIFDLDFEESDPEGALILENYYLSQGASGAPVIEEYRPPGLMKLESAEGPICTFDDSVLGIAMGGPVQCSGVATSVNEPDLAAGREYFKTTPEMVDDCDAIVEFRASCIRDTWNRATGYWIRSQVVLADNTHALDTVEIEVNGVKYRPTIRGRFARLAVPNFDSNEAFVATLTRPAACQVSIVDVCP